jgi:hypothetical protein
MVRAKGTYYDKHMVTCERCGCEVNKHCLEAHQKTKKCAKLALAAERMALFEEFCRKCEETL